MNPSSKWVAAFGAATTIVTGCSSSGGGPSAFKNQGQLQPAAAVGVPILLDAGAIEAAASPADGSAGAVGLGDPTVLAALHDVAMRAAAIAGVSKPMTMTAVAASDHQAAETFLSGAQINDHSPVYVVKMTGGPFTARRHPPGVPAPQGSVLRLTVDAATYRVTDTGYVNAEPDLTQIGPVVVNLLP